jgi:hypothetical protein
MKEILMFKMDSRFRGNDKRGLNSLARSFAGAQDDKRDDMRGQVS